MPPHYTIFGEILDQLLAAIPGALGAILADWEGETVDMARVGVGDDDAFFDGQLAAAHWGVVYNFCRQKVAQLALGKIDTMMMRFERQQVVTARVTDDYYLTTVLGPDADMQRALAPLTKARQRIEEEM